MSDKERSSFKYIYVYDCSKFDKCGNGIKTKRIDYTDDTDLKLKSGDFKAEQSRLNKEYRREHPIKKSRRGGVKNQHVDLPSTGKYHTVDTDIIANTLNMLPAMELDCPLTGDNITSGCGNSIVILGSSKAGKTHVMKAVFEKYFKTVAKKHNLISTLFSVNDHADVYRDFTGVIKCNKFNADSQKLINQMKKVNMIQKNKFNYLIMLDDIIDSKYSNTLNNLILTYRNSNFNSIISLQYPYLLSKASRSSINQCLFGHFNSDESIETAIKSFLGSKFTALGYQTLPSQIRFYKKCTADYHFLYYYSRKDLLVRFKLQI